MTAIYCVRDSVSSIPHRCLPSRRGILRAKVEEGALFNRVAAETGRDPAALSVEEKTKILVLERLRMNKEIKDQWRDV